MNKSKFKKGYIIASFLALSLGERVYVEETRAQGQQEDANLITGLRVERGFDYADDISRGSGTWVTSEYPLIQSDGGAGVAGWFGAINQGVRGKSPSDNFRAYRGSGVYRRYLRTHVFFREVHRRNKAVGEVFWVRDLTGASFWPRNTFYGYDNYEAGKYGKIYRGFVLWDANRKVRVRHEIQQRLRYEEVPFAVIHPDNLYGKDKQERRRREFRDRVSSGWFYGRR